MKTPKNFQLNLSTRYPHALTTSAKRFLENHKPQFVRGAVMKTKGSSFMSCLHKWLWSPYCFRITCFGCSILQGTGDQELDVTSWVKILCACKSTCFLEFFPKDLGPYCSSSRQTARLPTERIRIFAAYRFPDHLHFGFDHENLLQTCWQTNLSKAVIPAWSDRPYDLNDAFRTEMVVLDKGPICKFGRV